MFAVSNVWPPSPTAAIFLRGGIDSSTLVALTPVNVSTSGGGGEVVPGLTLRRSCYFGWRNDQTQCRRSATRAHVIRAKYELKPPPYPMDALEPHMSQETLSFHWGKHQRTYVEKLNYQIAGSELDGMSLEDILILTYNKGDMLPAFNNAAQVWNHEFFWESMTPKGGGRPSGDLMQLIERDFGSFEKFSKEFSSAAATQFGSGWAWLAYKANRLNVGNAVNPLPSEEDKKLVIVKSPNAVNPLVWDYSPLLTIDVWEHAYYIDYQNRRPDYISIFMEKLVSWEAVSARLKLAEELAAKRDKEEEMETEEGKKQSDNGSVEMYVDNDSDGSESE